MGTVKRFAAALSTAPAVFAAELPPTESRPLQVLEGSAESRHGYVSSNACRSCHAIQSESWHRSDHRTMTQAVTSDTVIADFDDVRRLASTAG